MAVTLIGRPLVFTHSAQARRVGLTSTCSAGTLPAPTSGQVGGSGDTTAVIDPSDGTAGAPVDGHPGLDAVLVLAGGRSARLGTDKTRVLLGGVSVLDRLLRGLADVVPQAPVVVVGPRRPTVRPVVWCREEPPGGGPVAGLACGLAVDAPLVPDDGLLAVLAADLPFAAPALLRLLGALTTAPSGTDAALGVDEDGHDQLLVGVHRAGALRRAVAAQSSAGAVRRVVSRLSVVRVPLPSPLTLDVDTVEDLQRARALASACE
jgi:molybdopterin-guanine dinucleotide biosynthesis protein A